MNIDLINVDFTNKGSFLMIHAIVKQISEFYSDYKIAVDLRSSGKRQRSDLNLYQILRRDIYSLPFQLNGMLNFFANAIPESIRKTQKIVLENEINAVLDSAGFAYSDQGSYSLVRLMSQRYRKWKKQGKKLILLPQAFGPFELPQLSDQVKIIVDCADLVFARDQISYNHLLSTFPKDTSKIKISPDFTNLVEGKLPDYFKTDVKRPCIIPNYRMLDKTPQQIRDQYIPTIVYCINYLLEQNIEPFFLIHESGHDYQLIQMIQNKLENKLDVIHEPNPIYIKGILANCSFVISSRYHGLINSMSQGVPVIASSWSHKYEMLLEDYHCSDYVISFHENTGELRRMIDLMIEPDNHKRIVNDLLKVSAEQKKLTIEMWDQVFQCLEKQI